MKTLTHEIEVRLRSSELNLNNSKKNWLSKSEIEGDTGRDAWPQLSTFSAISEFGYFGESVIDNIFDKLGRLQHHNALLL